MFWSNHQVSGPLKSTPKAPKLIKFTSTKVVRAQPTLSLSQDPHSQFSKIVSTRLMLPQSLSRTKLWLLLHSLKTTRFYFWVLRRDALSSSIWMSVSRLSKTESSIKMSKIFKLSFTIDSVFLRRTTPLDPSLSWGDSLIWTTRPIPWSC